MSLNTLPYKDVEEIATMRVRWETPIAFVDDSLLV